MNSPLTIMGDMDGIPNIIFKYGIDQLHRTRNALIVDKDEITQSLVKKNLDIIILSMLNDNPVHGYKIIADLHNTFGVLLSPGTLYPLLYRLEAEGLIRVKEDRRRKNYSLTPKGLKRTEAIVESFKRNTSKIIQFIDGNLSSPD